jgi:hypothetical protein
MLSCSEIKADLREIRNYYEMKKAFDKAVVVPKNLTRYSSVITNAPAKLFIVYYSLYVENKTHDDLARKLGYSRARIDHLNEDVVFFLQRNLAS